MSKSFYENYDPVHVNQKASFAVFTVLSGLLALSGLVMDDAFAQVEPLKSFNNTYFEENGLPLLERHSLLGSDMISADINNDGNLDLLSIAFESWDGYEQDNDMSEYWNPSDLNCTTYQRFIHDPAIHPELICFHTTNITLDSDNPTQSVDFLNGTVITINHPVTEEETFIAENGTAVKTFADTPSVGQSRIQILEVGNWTAYKNGGYDTTTFPLKTTFGKLYVYFLNEQKDIIDTATITVDDSPLTGIGQHFDGQSGCLSDPTRNLAGHWDRDGDGFVDSWGPGNNTAFALPANASSTVEDNILARDIHNFDAVRYYDESSTPGNHFIILGMSGYDYGGDGPQNGLGDEITTGVVMVVEIDSSGQVVDCTPINSNSEPIHQNNFVNPAYPSATTPGDAYLGWPLALSDIDNDGILDIIAGQDGHLNDLYYDQPELCFDEWGNFDYTAVDGLPDESTENDCGNVTDLVVMLMNSDMTVRETGLVKGKDMGQTLENNYLQYAKTIDGEGKIAVAHTRGASDSNSRLYILDISFDNSKPLGERLVLDSYNILDEDDVNQFECQPGIQCNLQTVGVDGNDDGFGKGFQVIEDLNGDGLNDFLVGSLFADIDSKSHGECGGDGTVYILYMSDADTIKGVQQILPPYEQACGHLGQHLFTGGAGDYFGHSIAILNHTNGLPTFAVGATQYDGIFDRTITGSKNQLMNYPDAETGAIFLFGFVGVTVPIADTLYCNQPESYYDNVIRVTESDTLTRGTSGNDLIIGTNGTDTIKGKEGDDCIYGMGGNDLLVGNQGDDILYGGLGNDLLQGRTGNDTLYGEAGDDDLQGYNGSDTMFGGSGNDGLSDKGSGPDYFDGGAGDDNCHYVTSVDTYQNCSLQ